ncbi:endosomal/lysosomal proton channel TMEM175-like isoform X2 [Hydra vulgaris]|uniref:Endosomal/lysosomal proton channel TMEM175 n=1 Tax=Hydra vulgaris TaxID=6087 RepID=A0ABM4DBW2_HYDVU
MDTNLQEKSGIQKKKIRTRTKHKQLEEQYDKLLNEILPENFHRGDITSSSRMLAYSDTLMATCATFLVLPIKKLRNKQEQEPLLDLIYSMYAEFIMFFLGYIIVLNIWENMNNRAIVIKRVDDFVLTLVIFETMGATVLPFSLALKLHYPKEKISILTTCAVLGVLEIIDIGIVLYATHSPKLLHVDLKNWSKSDLRELMMIMTFRPLVSLTFLITAGVFCFFNYHISLGFISLLVFMPSIRKLYWFIRRKMNKFKETKKDSFLLHFSKGNVSKERIQSMTDSAIAVIACMLIMDIPVERFSEVNLIKKIKSMKAELFSFFVTFCLVSAVWYVNHAVLHLFKTVSSLMLYFQKNFLAFCCLFPLAGNTVLNFGYNGNQDSNIALRFSSLILFCSSIANFVMLMYGLLTGSKFLHNWASLAYFKTNIRQHLYTFVKVLNIPFWSLVCSFASFSSSFVVPYVVYTTFLAAVCAFFAIKIILMNHIGKKFFYFKRKTVLKNKKGKYTRSINRANQNSIASSSILV